MLPSKQKFKIIPTYTLFISNNSNTTTMNSRCDLNVGFSVSQTAGSDDEEVIKFPIDVIFSFNFSTKPLLAKWARTLTSTTYQPRSKSSSRAKAWSRAMRHTSTLPTCVCNWPNPPTLYNTSPKPPQASSTSCCGLSCRWLFRWCCSDWRSSSVSISIECCTRRHWFKRTWEIPRIRWKALRWNRRIRWLILDFCMEIVYVFGIFIFYYILIYYCLLSYANLLLPVIKVHIYFIIIYPKFKKILNQYRNHVHRNTVFPHPPRSRLPSPLPRSYILYQEPQKMARPLDPHRICRQLRFLLPLMVPWWLDGPVLCNCACCWAFLDIQQPKGIYLLNPQADEVFGLVDSGVQVVKAQIDMIKEKITGSMRQHGLV